MKKIITTLLISVILLSTHMVAKADVITLRDGREIKGKIYLIIDNLVDIKTDNGTKRIVRNYKNTQAMDIIEVGYFSKKRKIIGQILNLNDTDVYIKTTTGDLKISRFWVRKVYLKDYSTY